VTTAPACLLTARTLLLTHLKPHGLSPAAVGIVGDSAHRGGYHCGRDRLVSDDYSNRVARDKAGLSDYASALDIGSFTYGKHTLRTFSVWLVAECARGAADTKDIREVIYSPDGKNVKRWDRERRSSTGDDSHLWHTHISYYRDATKAGRNLSAVFRRYLTVIGLIRAEVETDLTPNESRMLRNADRLVSALIGGQTTVSGIEWPIGVKKDYPLPIASQVAGTRTDVATLLARSAAPTPVTVDPATLAAGVGSKGTQPMPSK